ncbi:MAG: metallophosphoesterase, partial [Endomicrobiia bacterium]
DKLYGYLIKIARQYNLDLSVNFSELDKYFQYIELSQKINPLQLLEENQRLTNEINSRFSQTKAQMDVVFLINFEKYLNDYLTSKITSDDYEYYKKNVGEYKKLWAKYVDNKVLSLLDEYIAEADKFYTINAERNTYFTDNIFNEVNVSGITPAVQAQDEISKIIENMSEVKRVDVIITGGFHTGTVSEILKNHNVSYIVITPNVTGGIKMAEDTYYKVAKEQSKISFQALANLVASLSPVDQKKILVAADPELAASLGAVAEDTRERILDNAQIKELADTVKMAEMLLSDDSGSIKQKIVESIKERLGKNSKASGQVDEDLVNYINKDKLQKAFEGTQNIEELIEYSLRIRNAKNDNVLNQSLEMLAELTEHMMFFVKELQKLASLESPRVVTDFSVTEKMAEVSNKADLADFIFEELIGSKDLLEESPESLADKILNFYNVTIVDNVNMYFDSLSLEQRSMYLGKNTIKTKEELAKKIEAIILTSSKGLEQFINAKGYDTGKEYIHKIISDIMDDGVLLTPEEIIKKVRTAEDMFLKTYLVQKTVDVEKKRNEIAEFISENIGLTLEEFKEKAKEKFGNINEDVWNKELKKYMQIKAGQLPDLDFPEKIMFQNEAAEISQIVSRSKSYQDFISSFGTKYGEKTFGISRTRQGNYLKGDKTRQEIVEFGDCDKISSTWAQFNDQNYEINRYGTQDIKFHISASSENAQEIYDLVRPVLDKYNMVFKVAVNKGKLQSLKNTQVGKFITIYLPKGQSLQTLIDLGLELDAVLSSYNNRTKSPEILNEIKIGSSGILTVRDEAMERGVETEKQLRALQFVDFFNKSKENMLKIWNDRTEPNNSDAVKELAEKVIASKGSYRDFVDVVKNMYGKKAFGISRTRKGSIDRKTKDEFSGEMYNEFGDSDYGPNMLGTWSTLYDQDYMMSPKGGHGHVKGNEDIKLHISASVDNAQETYDLVRPILDKYNIPFKVARTMENLIELNSGNDTQVGKFMTIYLPKGQSYDVLTDLALELDSVLSSHIFSSQSPVILNELQLGSSGKLTFRDEEQERGTSNHNDIEKNFLIKFNTAKAELTDIWKELGGENLEQNEQLTVQKEAKIVLDNANKYAASENFSSSKYGNGILRSAQNILISHEMPELLSQNEAEKQLEMYIKADIEGKEKGFQKGSFIDLQNSGKRVILVGDTHAKYENIISIVEKNRADLENGLAVLVFLGDMIHSEDNLVEMNSSMATMQYYMWLKIAYPQNVYMLAGNHDIGTGMTKGGVSQGALYYHELEGKYSKDYVYNYRNAVLETFALIAEGDEWIAVHAGPVKGKTVSDISKEIGNKTILEIFKDKNIKDINNIELGRIDFLKKLTWSRETDGNYNSEDVKKFAGNKMLVVGHSPRSDKDVNWYWDSSKDIEGEGKADSHIIIFAGAKEAFGYMEFIPEKISELDKTENSLQSKSTVEYLNKIGNSNFIKWLYSAKANKIGENFRYTVLGTALGVIFETFSLWSPNFIESHDNPTMAMKIVVLVIRALSIGIGVTVAISPLSPLLIVPAVILTEWITHFSWNQIQILKGIQINILQKNNSQIESNSDIFKNIAENIDFNDLLIDWEKEIPFIADATKEILKDRINNLKLSEHNLKAVQLSVERITKSILLGQKQFMFDAFSRSPEIISYADIIFDDLVSLYEKGDFTVDENNFGVKKIIQEIENNEKRELTKEEKDIIIIFVKHIKHEILSVFGSKLNFVPRLYAFKTYNDAKNKVINDNLSLETWIHICEGHMPGFNQRKSATGDEYYSENEFAYDYSFRIDELKYIKDIYSEPDAVIALNERDSFGNKQVLYIKNVNGNIYICDILENGAIKSIYKLSKSKYLQSDGQLDFDSINKVYGRKGMMLQNNKDYNYQNLQNQIYEYMKNLSEEFTISNNLVEKNGTIILKKINSKWVSPKKSAEIFFEIQNKGVFFRYDGKYYFYNTNIGNVFDFGILGLYNLEFNDDNKKEEYFKIKINGEMFLLSKRGNISRESDKKFMEGDKTLIFYNTQQIVFKNFDENGKFQHKNRSFGYEVMERTNSMLGFLFLRINEYANFIFKISKNGSKWVVEKSKLEVLAKFKYINDPNSYIYVNIKSDDSDESIDVKISPVTGKILSGMSKLELFDKLNIILMLNKPDSEINIKQYGNGERKFDVQIQQIQINRESINSEAFPKKNFISHAAIRTVDTVKTLKIITRTAVKIVT